MHWQWLNGLRVQYIEKPANARQPSLPLLCHSAPQLFVFGGCLARHAMLRMGTS